MKIFGFNIIRKKDLKNNITNLEKDLLILRKDNEELFSYALKLQDENNKLKSNYPFQLKQVVYDIQFRNTEGKFTKRHPSIDHSLINEITVTERNYFNLVKRYYKKDVFTTKTAAEEYLKKYVANLKN